MCGCVSTGLTPVTEVGACFSVMLQLHTAALVSHASPSLLAPVAEGDSCLYGCAHVTFLEC